jgi:hypothetical protein
VGIDGGDEEQGAGGKQGGEAQLTHDCFLQGPVA